MKIDITSQLRRKIRTYVDDCIHREFQVHYEDVRDRGFKPVSFLTVPTTLFMDLQFDTMKQLDVEILEDGNYLSKYPVTLILRTAEGEVFFKDIIVDIKINIADHKDIMFELHRKTS